MRLQLLGCRCKSFASKQLVGPQRHRSLDWKREGMKREGEKVVKKDATTRARVAASPPIFASRISLYKRRRRAMSKRSRHERLCPNLPVERNIGCKTSDPKLHGGDDHGDGTKYDGGNGGPRVVDERAFSLVS
jgi:hypothetical protein